MLLFLYLLPKTTYRTFLLVLNTFHMIKNTLCIHCIIWVSVVVSQVVCVGDLWEKMACARTCWLNACPRNNAVNWEVVPCPHLGARPTWTPEPSSSGASWATACHARDAKVTLLYCIIVVTFLTFTFQRKYSNFFGI